MAHFGLGQTYDRAMFEPDAEKEGEQAAEKDDDEEAPDKFHP
jgi:hypothetical protein